MRDNIATPRNNKKLELILIFSEEIQITGSDLTVR